MSNNDYSTHISIHLNEDGTASIELSSFDSESENHPKVRKSTRKYKSEGRIFKVKKTETIFNKTEVRLKKFVR